MEEQGEWLECVVDNDYEIFSEYPYPIRRKGSDRVISEHLTGESYYRLRLGKKCYLKHRIVAEQFIPNDDPEHKTQVDHINHNRTDNRIGNLRWCSPSENQRNKPTNGHGHQYVFLDELPDTAEPLEAYNGHEFDGLFVDFENEKLYLFNGVRYRELILCRTSGHLCYYVNDIEKVNRAIAHKVLFG